MAEKHERVEMKFKGRDAQKHRYSNGREKNVWYHVFECPACGKIKRPIENASRGKAFFCDGTGENKSERMRRLWRKERGLG